MHTDFEIFYCSWGNMPKESYITAENAVDLHAWFHLQGLLADMTGATLMMYREPAGGEVSAAREGCCDLHGELCVTSPPLAPISNDNPYCKALRENPKGRHLCEKYCTRSMKRALELGSPLSFQCYAGFLNFAIPIVLDDQYRFVLLGGRVFDAPLTEYFIGEVGKHVDMEAAELKTLADMTPIKATEAFQADAKSIEGLSRSVLINSFQKNIMSGTVSRLKALLNVGIDLSAKASNKDIFQLFFNSLGFLYGVQDASVMLMDSASRRFKTVEAVGPYRAETGDYGCTATEGLAAKAMEYRTVVYINDTFDLLRVGLPEEISSCFIFPLVSREQLVGIINIFNVELSQDDLPAIASFCRYLHTAIETASLRDSIRSQMDTLFAVSEACSALCDDASAQELFQIILDKSASMLKAEQGSLMLFNEEAKDLVIRATRGFNEKLVEHFRIRPGEGIAGQVLASGKPLVVADIATDPRLSRGKRQRYKTGSFMSVPLGWKKAPLGVLNFADKTDGSSFGENDLHMMNLLAAQASMALDRAKLLEKTESLRKLSVTDPLTGLFSRRYLEEMLHEEIERSLRYGRPLSLVMIDLDNFKPYNDTYGHQAGDEMLKEVGRVLQAAVRAIDAAVRYGGDEFAVILPETDSEGARLIASRIIKDMSSSIIWRQRSREATEQGYTFEAVQRPSGELVEVHLSLSMGIASVPNDARSMKGLINKADKALYAAKARGKNRVELYSPNGGREF